MRGPIHVLLIDDNFADAELARETLADGRLQAEVTTACNGREALSFLQQALSDERLPDLILLGFNMPELDGPGLLAELRQREVLRSIPVVMLASSDAEEDIVHSYRLGARYYLTKPLGLSEFQETVRSVEDFWLSLAGTA